MTLTPLTHDLLADDGVTHGFFTRQGGGSYDRGDLNCGFKTHDNPDHIKQNRALVAQYLGGTLEGLRQIHSAEVLTITKSLNTQRPTADALVTNVPGLAISILTADCGPILFFDPSAKVIGAAHSGWKGTIANIAGNTIKAMEALGAKRDNIVAVLGPTIAQASYEVGPDFPNLLTQACDNPMLYMKPSGKEGHWLFDLPALIGNQLDQLVYRHAILDKDTYALESQFFSHRRSTHRNKPDDGRQISGICLHE